MEELCPGERMILEEVEVRWKSFALQAALFTSLFWEVAKQLFGWYVLHLGRFSMVYGSLSALIIFFLWVYYSSVIVILGAEAVYLLEKKGHSLTLSSPAF